MTDEPSFTIYHLARIIALHRNLEYLLDHGRKRLGREMAAMLGSLGRDLLKAKLQASARLIPSVEIDDQYRDQLALYVACQDLMIGKDVGPVMTWAESDLEELETLLSAIAVELSLVLPLSHVLQ